MSKESTIKLWREELNDILEKTYRVLLKYPLCDHCLGRLFAKKGRGLGNDERGRAFKTLLSIQLYEAIKEEPLKAKNIVKTLARNGGGPLLSLYKTLYGESIGVEKCYICEGRLSHKYFNELAEIAIEILREYNASSFLIGVSISQETRYRELNVIDEIGIDYSESIKNEIKREVGKIVRDKTGIEPDFEKPDVVIIFEFETNDYRVIVNPVLLEGYYWKKARNISHTIWISKGVKQYPYSLQEFFNDSLRELFDAEEVVLHASGREDVDARMLGTGRPMVIEIKNPKFRLVDKELLNSILCSDVIEAIITKDSSRSRIKYLKTELSKKTKVYRALVYVNKKVSQKDLEKLEEFFKNRTIRQLTPTRILRRKKEHERIRKVYEVKARLVSDNLFEALIRADGGLYIKELISGDNDRTNPSFSSVLGAEAYCIELDVIGVEVFL